MKVLSLIRSLAVLLPLSLVSFACGRAELPIWGGTNGGANFGGASSFGGSVSGSGGSVPQSCGDGKCGPGEDSGNCEIDCGYCGDGVCSGNEPVMGCPDCGSQPVCGNGVCEGDEPAYCGSDCGQVCGNGVCESNEPSVCPGDCVTPACGNGVCEPFVG
ncbi:MAG TPA: hypothetical protein VEX18_14020, partial [Polyangiaceae bacterium]|nr:hypothetical protein [Polyangiaceae bacterium]